MVLVAAGANWVIFFLGLELLSLALYVLIAIKKGEPYGNEAALKYFIMGAVASAFLTFGLALLYAMTGTLRSPRPWPRSKPHPGHLPVILLALALVLTGIGFKISLVPFHLWTPDVYQGVPGPHHRVSVHRLQGGPVRRLTAFCPAGGAPGLGLRLAGLMWAWRSSPWRWATSPPSIRPRSNGSWPTPPSPRWATCS